MSQIRRIKVALPGGGGYEIHVGKGALFTLGTSLAEAKRCQKAVVISDENVGPAYGKLVVKRLQEAGYETYDLLVPPGEESKSLDVAHELWISLAQYGLSREDLVVAVGGGVVGDLAGFVASTFMRGIDFAQVPTSLLAMVDASIGGKTAVDLECGKNLVGTFHQPVLVCADTRCLHTLHDEDWANGFAEVAKCAMVAPRRSSYEWLRDNASGLVEHDDLLLEQAVYQAASFKASVVADDEHEAGRRECLNYGHTLAHAIENAAGYGTIGHGRAVAEGMRFAARLSVEVLGLDPGVVKRQDALLDSLGLAQIPWTSTPERLYKLMKGDKKARNGNLRFVLLHDIAKWETVTVPDETAIAHLEAWCAAKERLIEETGHVYGEGR